VNNLPKVLTDSDSDFISIIARRLKITTSKITITGVQIQCNTVVHSVLSGSRAGSLINSVRRTYHNRSKAKQTTSAMHNEK